MKRYFNTSGPNIIEQHYTLMREELVEEGMDLVKKERYFTIWAPRQTGKSTYFRLLADKLKETGYAVIHLNVENYLDATKKLLTERLAWELQQKNITIKASSFAELENKLYKITDAKVVLIIDEIEGLNPDLFGQFLHTLRNLYHSRQQHCLKSVILVGINNIVGVVEDNASPFNIADNIHVSYFTNQESLNLFAQHETETGQLFEAKVKEKISDITANQPGLVNAFGKKLTEDYKEKKVIGYKDYLTVENWFITKAIDKNISNIIGNPRSVIKDDSESIDSVNIKTYIVKYDEEKDF